MSWEKASRLRLKRLSKKKKKKIQNFLIRIQGDLTLAAFYIVVFLSCFSLLQVGVFDQPQYLQGYSYIFPS